MKTKKLYVDTSWDQYTPVYAQKRLMKDEYIGCIAAYNPHIHPHPVIHHPTNPTAV